MYVYTHIYCPRHMCVCVSCMCGSMRVRSCESRHGCMCSRACVCIHACTLHAFVCLHAHVAMCIYFSIAWPVRTTCWSVHNCTAVCTVCMCVHMNLHAHVHMCIHICVDLCHLCPSMFMTYVCASACKSFAILRRTPVATVFDTNSTSRDPEVQKHLN